MMHPVSTSNPAWMSSADAAVYLGITTRTLYRLADRGEIAAYQIGRVYRFRVADLDAYLESARVQPGTLRHLYPPAAS